MFFKLPFAVSFSVLFITIQYAVFRKSFRTFNVSLYIYIDIYIYIDRCIYLDMLIYKYIYSYVTLSRIMKHIYIYICIDILASVTFFICSVAFILLCYPCEALEGPILTRVCIIK